MPRKEGLVKLAYPFGSRLWTPAQSCRYNDSRLPMPKAFVAYSGRDKQVGEVILAGVKSANAKAKQIQYEPWEFNDIGGKPLLLPIVSRIDESSFIVADITYLNLNVVYEIGLSIGKKKRVHLVRRQAIDGDKEIAQQVGIFDTLGYEEYSDSNDLTHLLANYTDSEPLAFSETLDRLAPVYVVEPPIKSDSATSMTSCVKKARYRYRSFNPVEDIRISASDAIRQVAASSGILVSLEDPDSSRFGAIQNIRSLFVAGLSHGMAKPTLILCPNEYLAPLDVRDEVKRYGGRQEIATHIHELSLEITEYLQESDPISIDGGTLLQSLQVGDPTAENEMTTLAEYYLRLDQYDRAVKGEVNLVVGRKGSGKTAMFIQVRDRIRANKKNIVVDLKPEGYQLVKLKEELLAYLTEGAKQHLITAFWEYLLLLEIAYKLLEKDRSIHRHNHDLYQLYRDLEDTYKSEKFSAGGDFSERLLTLSQRLSAKYQARFGTAAGQKLSAQEVSELVYHHEIPRLREHISKYLETKQMVWVLFDNLDKGWSTQGIDTTDAIVLRCLIDAGRKLERDMRKAHHELHCVVFIRNDVYEHLMQNSADYGKEMRAVLDWTDPDLLREMLRLRLVSGIRDADSRAFETIWPRICVSHYKGEDTSSYIIDRSLMRPRNVLKIFSHCRGFANNLSHPKITDDDIEKGLLAYSHDLLIELDRELSDVFPRARDLIYHLVDAKCSMSRIELARLISSTSILQNESDKVVDFLLYYGVIGLRSSESDIYIYNVNYDAKMLRIRVQRAGDSAVFAINPAFWPALGMSLRPQEQSGPGSS